MSQQKKQKMSEQLFGASMDRLSLSSCVPLSQKKVLLSLLFLGFSSGLPFLLTLSTLSYWITECGASKTVIGLLILISAPYSLKFLWAPFLDYYTIPFLHKKLGQRRSWMIVAQICISLSLFGMASSAPEISFWQTAVWASLVAFFSATQDIMIDAYRIETIASANNGFGAAFESIGFRLGMIVSGAGALYLATLVSWSGAYTAMAFLMSVGIITTLFLPTPDHPTVLPLKGKKPLTPKAVFLRPFLEMRQEPHFCMLVFFIFLIKIPDAVLNAMCAPFLYDLAFTKIDFANVTKVFGITLMVLGGLCGGLFMKKIGTVSCVFLCITLQFVSCLMFVIQSLVGHHFDVLTITVGFESFSSGLTSAVFIGYISGFCKKPYTAAHFTILYSIGSLSRVLTSTGAGWLADNTTWVCLFSLTTFLTLPCLWVAARLQSFQECKNEKDKAA